MECQQTTPVSESGLDVILRNIAGSAAAICGCPMACLRVCRVRGSHLLFAAGIDDSVTTINLEHLLRSIDGTECCFEVPNASIDSRFSGSPMVTSAPFIRYLYIVPLRAANNHHLGTLSIMAPHKVELTDIHCVALKELAGIASVALQSVGKSLQQEQKSLPVPHTGIRKLDTPTLLHNQIETWELNLDTVKLQGNEDFFEILGDSQASVDGTEENWLLSVHPEDVRRVREEFRHALASSDAFESEYRVLCRDGTLKHINTRATVLRDANMQPQRVIGSSSDVSDRVRAQRALESSERRLRLITDKLPVLIASIDKSYRYTFANNNFESWYSLGGRNIPGHHVPGVIGKSVEEVFETASFHTIKPYLDQAMAGNEISAEIDMPPSKAPPHIFLYCGPEFNDDGEIIGVFGLVLDRTAEVQSRKQIAESEHQLRAITDNLPALIAYVDTEERIRFINRTYCEWLQIPKAAALGKTLEQLEGPSLYAKRKDFFQRALQGEHVELEAEYEGHSSVVYMQTKLVPDRDVDGQVRGIFKLCTDVSELKRVETELRRLARIDVLTGLPNRGQFSESLKLAHDRSVRTGAVAALLFLDIDYFKQVNDSMGHGVGDSVLREFARRVKASIRSTDTAARLAGDEFVAILEDLTTEQQALAIASKINDSMRKPMWIDDEEIRVTTSIGIAFHRGPATDLDEWIVRADNALYHAKAIGRDTFVVESDVS